MRRRAILRWALPAVFVAGMGGLAWWYVMLSPQGHTLPADADGLYLQSQHSVFAYATLTVPVVRWMVLGESVPTEEGVLPGFHRDGLNLVASPGEQVAGEYFEVSGPQLRRLDRYERLGSRYERARYRLLDGREAWVYRRLEE